MSTLEAAQRWAEHMRARAQRKPYTKPAMSPWDENVYFQTPVQTDFSLNPGQSAKILIADPQRVGIIFGTAGTGVSVFIGLNNPPSATSGFVVQSTTLPMVFLQAQYGPLPTLEWFGNNPSAGTAVVSIIEIKLLRWP